MTERTPLPGRHRHGAIAALDRAIGQVVTVTSFLVLPLSLLLLLQWPLRDWLQGYSREANDLAQVLFALYASVAITAATRHHAHLAADTLARGYARSLRRHLARFATLLILVPWSVFVLYAAWPMVAQSVRQLEGFPDTFNPGYFIIKLALLVLVLLTLLQGIIDVLRPPAEAPP